MATKRKAPTQDSTSNSSTPTLPPPPRSAGASRFAFVLDRNQAGARNHAMRQYWRERRTAGQVTRREPRQRRLLPKDGQGSPLKSSSDEFSSVTPVQTNLGVRTQVLAGINHALASSRLDPFDTFSVTLTSEHHT